jgi:very-short-patch-repair endonuclease
VASIDENLARFAEQHHGIITLEQAEHVGISPAMRDRRIRNGRWIVLHPGVYRLSGAPPTWRGKLLAACHAAPGSGVASHRSAASLLSLPGGSTRMVEITCERWQRLHHAGLVVHETGMLPPEDVGLVDGIPCMTVERTLLSLGAVLAASVVEMAVDEALRRELTTLSALDAIVRRLAGRGRGGVGVLRRMVALHSKDAALTESVMETRLKQLLRRHGLPGPEFQHEVRSGNRFVARVDAAYPDSRIAIEYDSYEHHTGRAALVRDSRRRNALAGIGWTVISVTAADIATGGEHAVAMIRAALSRSGAPATS